MLHEATGRAWRPGRELEGLEVRRPTLEDVYLDLRRGADDVEAEVADA